MAWDAIEGGGYTGDLPADAFADALERIARGYEDRFGRLPMLHEVLRAFETVLAAARFDVLYDPERITEMRIHVAPPAASPVDPGEYEGSWSEDPPPDGTYWVRERATGTDVLRCYISIEDRMLWARYEIMHAGLTHADARILIIHAILKGFAGDAYAEDADVISFVSIGTGEPNRVVIPYPE